MSAATDIITTMTTKKVMSAATDIITTMTTKKVMSAVTDIITSRPMKTATSVAVDIITTITTLMRYLTAGASPLLSVFLRRLLKRYSTSSLGATVSASYSVQRA